jgi:ATP-dependent exoDNAse (exonuclease V) beta subunit
VSAPPDAAAREQALDTTRSFIVKAPAGSGKTSLLVARYLALLAQAGQPEEVLAITFTRKATAQMRARVLEALALAREPAPRDAHGRRLHALAAAVAARDTALGWDLRDNPARLAIQTIDALCASLARRLPVLSGLGGVLTPVEDPLFLYRGAARRTQTLLDDPDLGAPVLRTLDHLDGNMASFEELLAQMLARRDQWLRYLHMDAPQARRDELEAGLAQVVAAGLAAARDALPAAQGAEIIALAAFAAERAAALALEPALAPLAGLHALPPAEGAALPAWKAIAQLLLTREGGLRKRPAAKLFSAKDTREEYRRMALVLDALAGHDALAAALARVRMLPAPRYDEAQWHTLLDLFRVLELAVAGLRLEFAQHGRSDFAEQVAGAAQALGEEQAPTDLALVLDYSIRHLLLDEFQDTSLAHFDIVRKLTAGWQPGDGRSLFLVGDPMQSIYRFREAEVSLFLDCFHGRGAVSMQAALDTVDLEPLTLSANFRSQQALVAWVNGAFASILPARDDAVRAAVAYEASHATHPPAGGAAVTVHAARGAGAGAQAARVAAVAAQCRAADAAASIAVLLRARSHGHALVAALEAHGLSWRGVDLQPLSAVPAVQDLHALCAALLHPLDRVSWLALLRAPWCGLTLDDLDALIAGDARVPVVALLAQHGMQRRLSADGRARLARVAPVLCEAHARAGRDRLAALVARTWRALGGPACLDGARLEDAHRYLRLVAELERDSARPDPDELARRAARLYAAPAPGAVDVEIMTIHKAKGLEFDVVLLPALERMPARDARSLLAWSQIATARHPHLLLAPLPPPEGEEHSPLHGFVRGVEQDKRALETARLLYVACTRARTRLHLFASVAWDEDADAAQAPREDTLLAHLWPVVHREFAALRAPVHESAAPPPARIARLPLHWRAPPAPRALPGAARAAPDPGRSVEFAWAGDTARLVGIVAHGLLRRISEEGAGCWDAGRLARAGDYARAALLAAGVPAAELDPACGAVAAALRRTLDDARGRWLLDAGHAAAHSEFAVSGMLEGALASMVLDRTFVDEDGVRWIVDYKTGQHSGGGVDEFLDREQQRYRAQLEGYATLLQALDPRPIRLALYFPAMAAWREWGFTAGA